MFVVWLPFALLCYTFNFLMTTINVRYALISSSVLTENIMFSLEKPIVQLRLSKLSLFIVKTMPYRYIHCGVKL